ncbi:uncharacterized protein LOC108937594 [Scleropages formosus]|uniref:uncharacterized protein LOC108937594 n=1 Tax=Scleropages formosus TaxID=113540 RepID=UPI0010FA89C4|nr:uncharacterized protein LOC108937594 [Scleropages formosus]
MEEDGPSGAPCGEHQESQEEFECPICQEVFRTPIRTKSCGHVFCRSCFVAAVRTRGPSCPLCRGPVCEDEKRAADVQRQMRERKGSCRACGALCFLSRMRTHYRYCRKYAEEYGGPPAAVALPGARAGDPNGAGASPIEGPLSMYCCPYCPLQGLRDTALVQHCLGSHPTARSPAVCPICAATSWGDASYRSGNFIGHLRLRHRFSYNNYMDMNEDEDVQVNRALQESRYAYRGVRVTSINQGSGAEEEAAARSAGMEGDGAERDPDHECPICMDALKEPVQLPACRHTFCRFCLMRSVESRRHCPVCRGDIDGDVIPAARNTSGAGGQVCLCQAAVSTAVTKRGTTARLAERTRFMRSKIRTEMRVRVPEVLGRTTASRARTPDVPEAFLRSNPTIQRLLEPYRAQRVPPNATPAGARQVILGAQGGPAAAPPGPVFSQPSIPPSPSFPDEEDLSEILEAVQCPANGPQDSQSSQNSQSSSVMAFSCPYCQRGGLDELDLLDHCNNHHQHDPRPVVCPVCAALPYGDPSYCSRNFIGHLNLRHCFYREDFMDVQQSDAMNEQAALWESLANAR